MRPLARAAQRACVRPGCPSPAGATLSFRYDSREAWLERLSEEPRPEAYDLCSSHAARTQAPHGWQLRDRRPREERDAGEVTATPEDLGGEHTVAVLAAALRSVPDPRPADERDMAAASAVTEAESLEDVPSPVLEPLRPAVGAAPAQPHPAPTGVAAPVGEREPPPPPEDLEPPPPPPPIDPAPQLPTLEDEAPPPAAGPSGTESPVEDDAPGPRPVLAARERRAGTERDPAPRGPARDW